MRPYIYLDGSFLILRKVKIKHWQNRDDSRLNGVLCSMPTNTDAAYFRWWIGEKDVAVNFKLPSTEANCQDASGAVVVQASIWKQGIHRD